MAVPITAASAVYWMKSTTLGPAMGGTWLGRTVLRPAADARADGHRYSLRWRKRHDSQPGSTGSQYVASR
jgi:hypothetical protein